MFPVVVLGIFYLLVSRHHGKLYALGDYKDDQSFLRTLSQEEREQKLEKDVEEAIPLITNEQSPISNQTSTSAWTTQRPNSEMRVELRLIENLVITKFESELNQRAERDVAVGDTGANFDALFQAEGSLRFLRSKACGNH